MNLSFIRPEYLTPFMFGFGTPFLLKLWNKWQKGCILTIFLLWVYFVWFGYIALMLRTYPASHTSAYFVGVVIAFLWTFLKSSLAVFEYLTDKIQDIRYFIADRRRTRQRRQSYQEQSTGYEQDRAWREREAEAERARREAEAKAYRANQNKKQNRSYEEILGLSAGWTREDLENAYRREAYRTHPDKWRGKPEYQEMEEAYRAVHKAYNELKKRQEQPHNIKPPPEENRTYEQILGLSAGWTQADLKEAYRRECKRLHPDKWVDKPEHIKKVMEEEFKVMKNAYEKLKK